MDEARVGLARYLGVKEQEVSFGPSTSQNTYVLAKAFGEWLVPGNAIIVTNQDHEANTGSWRRLSNQGVEVKEWQVNEETGELNLEDLDDLLDENVKLLCFPHCSNIVAHINPVKEIVSKAHCWCICLCRWCKLCSTWICQMLVILVQIYICFQATRLMDLIKE